MNSEAERLRCAVRDAVRALDADCDRLLLPQSEPMTPLQYALYVAQLARAWNDDDLAIAAADMLRPFGQVRETP